MKVVCTVARPCQAAQEECVTIPRQVGGQETGDTALTHLPCPGLLPRGPHRVQRRGLARPLPRLGVPPPAQANTRYHQLDSHSFDWSSYMQNGRSNSNVCEGL